MKKFIVMILAITLIAGTSQSLSLADGSCLQTQNSGIENSIAESEKDVKTEVETDTKVLQTIETQNNAETKEETETCTVTFIWDKTETMTKTVEKGQTVKPPKTKVDEYTHYGWVDENRNTFDFSTPITEDITLWGILYKREIPAVDSFHVIFDSRGGTKVEGTWLLPSDLIPRPKNPTKQGYIFLGWYTKDGVKWNFNDFPQGDMTLYAHWKKAEKDYSPQTGDDSDMLPWLLFMGIASMLLLMIFPRVYRKKIKHRG